MLPCKIQQKVEREKHLIDFAKNVSIIFQNSNTIVLLFIIITH